MSPFLFLAVLLLSLIPAFGLGLLFVKALVDADDEFRTVD